MRYYCMLTKCKKKLKTVSEEGPEGGGGGVPIPFPSPFFLPNPTSQCWNPIPTSRIQEKSQCYIYQLFSLRIHKIKASKYDPTKIQKFMVISPEIGFGILMRGKETACDVGSL